VDRIENRRASRLPLTRANRRSSGDARAPDRKTEAPDPAGAFRAPFAAARGSATGTATVACATGSEAAAHPSATGRPGRGCGHDRRAATSCKACVRDRSTCACAGETPRADRCGRCHSASTRNCRSSPRQWPEMRRRMPERQLLHRRLARASPKTHHAQAKAQPEAGTPHDTSLEERGRIATAGISGQAAFREAADDRRWGGTACLVLRI
jgi:hypothetical protein